MTLGQPGVVLPPRRPLRVLRLRLRRDVRAGRGVRLGAGVRVEGRGRLLLGDGCALADGVRVTLDGGVVRIEPGAVLGERSVIACRERITVGEAAVVGARVAIVDFGPRHADPERPVRLQGVASAPVSIGAGATVGHQAALGPGATVPAAGRVEAGTVR